MEYTGMIAVAKSADLTIVNNTNLCFAYARSFDKYGYPKFSKKIYGAPGMAFGVFTGYIVDGFYELKTITAFEYEVTINSQLYINIANFNAVLPADAIDIPTVNYYGNCTINKYTGLRQPTTEDVFRVGGSKTLFPQMDGVAQYGQQQRDLYRGMWSDLYGIGNQNKIFFNTIKKFVQIWEPGFERSSIFEKEFDLKLLNSAIEPYEAIALPNYDSRIPNVYSFPEPMNIYDNKTVKPLLIGDELKIKKIRCVGEELNTGYTTYSPYVDIELTIPMTGGRGDATIYSELVTPPITASIIFELSEDSIKNLKNSNYSDWNKQTVYKYSGYGKKTDITVKLPYFGDYTVWMVTENPYFSYKKTYLAEASINKNLLREITGWNHLPSNLTPYQYYLTENDMLGGYNARYLYKEIIDGVTKWFVNASIYATNQQGYFENYVKSNFTKISVQPIEDIEANKLYLERNNIHMKPAIFVDQILLKHAYEVVVTGRVESKGDQNIDQLGVCYKIGGTPTVGDTCVANDDFDMMSSFRFDISTLIPSTTYNARVYIKPEFGEVIYSELFTFTTNAAINKAYFKNKVIMSTITDSGVTLSAEYMNVGASVSEKGFVYAEAPAELFEDNVAPFPTYSNPKCNKVQAPIVSFNYSVQISGLKKNTLYFARPYAVYADGIEYGTVKMFKTLPHPYFSTPIIETQYFKNMVGKQVQQHSMLVSDGRTHIYRNGIILLKEAGNTEFFITTPGVIVDEITNMYQTQLTSENYLPSQLPAELEPDTHYSMRAFSENGLGIYYGDVTTFTTPDKAGTPKDDIEVMEPSNVSEDSATSGYEIYLKVPGNHAERGICWSLSPNPTLSDKFIKDNDFNDEDSIHYGRTWSNLSITGLKPNTTYYVAAYYIDKASVTPNPKPHYSQDKTFTTTDVGATPTKPLIGTLSYSGLMNNACTVKASVISASNGEITFRGFELSEVETFATSTKFNDAVNIVGDMTKVLTLVPSKKYYVRAYVKGTGSIEIQYSNVVTFTTPAISGLSKPSLINNGVVDNISQKSATLGGSVISDGGAAITERGIIYCQNTYIPSISNSGVPAANVLKFQCTGTTGRFVIGNTDAPSAIMTGLAPSTNYRCALYAINSQGVNISSIVDFRTKDVEVPVPPTVDKPVITESLITETGFEAIGNISFVGKYIIILDRGIYWSTSQTSSTYSGGISVPPVNGSWGGSVKVKVTSLSPNTVFWARTYVRYSQIVDEKVVEMEVVSDAVSVTTKATVFVGDAPVITKDIADTTGLVGVTLSLSVETKVMSGNAYQWYKKSSTDNDFVAISGKTTSILTITPTLSDNATKYKVIITANGKSTSSNIITLTANSEFQIAKFDSQQGDVSLQVGKTFRYTPKVSGTVPISYKYGYMLPVENSQFIPFTNENKSYLDITPTLADNGKRIRCVINNGKQDVYSDSFLITVNNGVDNINRPLNPKDQDMWIENIGGRIKKWVWHAAKKVWLLAGYELEKTTPEKNQILMSNSPSSIIYNEITSLKYDTEILNSEQNYFFPNKQTQITYFGGEGLQDVPSEGVNNGALWYNSNGELYEFDEAYEGVWGNLQITTHWKQVEWDRMSYYVYQNKKYILNKWMELVYHSDILPDLSNFTEATY